MSAFNVSLEAALYGSEVITVESCAQPDNIQEDLANNNDVYAPRKLQSWQRRRKGYYPPRRLESWHGNTELENEESSENDKQSGSNIVSKLQEKSNQALEKRGINFYEPGKNIFVASSKQSKGTNGQDVENRTTTKADFVKEKAPNYELAISSYDEDYFGKTQTFDITNPSSSVPMTRAYEPRNFFAIPKLVQTTDHQEQILEEELFIPDPDYETEEARDNEYDEKKFEELFEQNLKKSYQTALGIPESIDSSKLQAKSNHVLEKRGINFDEPGKHIFVASSKQSKGTNGQDVENRTTTKADFVKEKTPDSELAISSYDEDYFGKTQTFDITNQSSSVPMTRAYEPRNFFAIPKLVQTTDHQEQILEAELFIPDPDYETEEARDNEYDEKKFEELFEQNLKKSYQTALGIPESIDSSKLQAKSNHVLEKRGINFDEPGKHIFVASSKQSKGTNGQDVENRTTTKADFVKEKTPDYELAISSYDEVFYFGKTQTFDITNQSSSVSMTRAYEARNFFAIPKLVQTTDHQEQILEAELLIPDPDYGTEKARNNEDDGKKFEELFKQNFKKSDQTALGIPESIDSSQIELTTYELENYEKNDMIIFNHENFLSERKRRGTALDVAALEDTFKQFRFDVTTHDDLTKKDLFREIRKFSRKDFRESGCICVAILTHGQDHGYLRAFDTRYCERDVIACFDGRLNPSLVGKPIIFLIQACRGRHPASVVEAQSEGSLLPVQTVELDGGYTIEGRRRPMDSDIIMFHSSFFGRASIRVVEEGTWFIQSLCEQIRLHGDTDHLEKLFRRVRSIVAHMEYEGAKQMPVVTSTLLKKLYLKKTLFSSDIDGMYHNELIQPLVFYPFIHRNWPKAWNYHDNDGSSSSDEQKTQNSNNVAKIHKKRNTNRYTRRKLNKQDFCFLF